MDAFSLLEPTVDETPLLVEVPHAGLGVDGPSLAHLVPPARALGRDADLYVDELYADAPRLGATLLVGRVSRYVVDLNRSENDVDGEAVEGAPSLVRATRGIVWRLASDGSKVLERPLPRAEYLRRLELFYRPYHRALAEVVERKRARFGFAIVLAAHSMPSTSRMGGETVHRADVVPGTRGKTSASRTLIDLVELEAQRAKLSVLHDDPYQGGYTTQHYGRPGKNVHVVQVELARRLYMDEPTLTKHRGFDRTQEFCRTLVQAMARATP